MHGLLGQGCRDSFLDVRPDGLEVDAVSFLAQMQHVRSRQQQVGELFVVESAERAPDVAEVDVGLCSDVSHDLAVAGVCLLEHLAAREGVEPQRPVVRGEDDLLRAEMTCPRDHLDEIGAICILGNPRKPSIGLPAIAVVQPELERHAHVLDEWLAELRTTDVFTVLPDHVDTLYPTRAGGARFHPVLTGYVDRQTLQSARPSLRDRALDVVYRATSLPYWFGSHGQLKARIGEKAAAEAERLSLRHDISVAPGSVIAGDAWMRFLGSGRATVGTESGSSALDRRGELRAAILAALREHPGASFDEVASALPEGWDEHRFFALSPRHLEAAATGTAQILVPGAYSDVLSAGRHYLPVRPDLSDLADALEQVRDADAMQELVDRAHDEVVMSGLNTTDVFVAGVQEALRAHGCDPGDAATPSTSWRLRRRVATARGDIAAWRRPGGLVKRR